MSLWPINIATGIIEYDLCDGGTGIYAPDLCVDPKIYQESITDIGHFFYEPSNDRLVAYLLTRKKAWPGWDAFRYEWSAETGALIRRTWVGVGASHYANHAGVGSFNKIFTTWKPDARITEVPWNDLTGWASPMWSIDPSTWTPSRAFTHAVVNLQDNLIVGVPFGPSIEIWDISGTPTLRAALQLPNPLGYLAYESRETCWAITQTGLILKANYKENPPRWEMLSSVQDPSPDALNYFITWDRKRERLAVLRQRPDATDGACQCQLEFYRPLVRVANMTDPVPVSRHRCGEVVEIVAHLYGTAGEGITPYRVTASLQAPAGGTLLRSEGISTVNGAVSFIYKAPDVIGEETVILEATINDGEDGVL
jgi:hypothetical protein